MIDIIPSGQILGARLTGLDLAQPLGDRELGIVLKLSLIHI